MNSFEIIPAIDLIDGKCVRLSQGDYAQKKVYNEHPLEVAKQFEGAGIRRLHLVDLDGAKAGSVQNWKVLEQIAIRTNLVIDFGGGVKTKEDVSGVLNTGAALVTIGSLAVKRRELFLNLVVEFGADKFFIGADVNQEKLAVHGWLEQTDVLVYDFVNALKTVGLQQFFCTDIAKDGMMQGPSTELYKQILAQCADIQLTASGGVSKLDDLLELKAAGLHGAIVGKAIYEGTIQLKDLQTAQLVGA
ncbi:MAG TPA: 1-(5-phosphoribosyl)-5-[(5-phosphoribosylamino)methylideneamino]imidazole-4-carboxamide isomerase [Phnomibacter sp.]|nr:1-(5-phosphoribosyl)-5-[(5-phosphoribosylamino)methylideneamino]imidazole-4-carboxamide isomerase [Phnomibacter sp.]